MRLSLLSFNIHKGFNWSNQRLVIRQVRDAIRRVDADIVLLQEVVGHHSVRARELEGEWPKQSQFEFLADAVWKHYAYAQNAVYPDGHHGNAILSKYPIIWWENQDISTNELENRGCLHCQIQLGDGRTPLHVICLHLNMMPMGRKIQYEKIRERIERVVPKEQQLIVAGDFNDWDRTAGHVLESQLHMNEAFKSQLGYYAKTFPAYFPLLCLDRIYLRNITVLKSECHQSSFWRTISDHTALSVTVDL